jgi:hypothetical protein
VIESEQFSHHCGQGEFVRFAFGAQVLVKTREDGVVPSGGEGM